MDLRVGAPDYFETGVKAGAGEGRVVEAPFILAVVHEKVEASLDVPLVSVLVGAKQLV